MSNFFPMHGGCVCGAIRYILNEPPLLVQCCYCTACQRQTGSSSALNAIIESTAISLHPPRAPTVPGPPDNPNPVPAGHLPGFARATSATPALDPDLSSSSSSSSGPSLLCLPTESGLGQTVAHCPRCLTALWNHYADAGPHLAYVRVGTLDRAFEVRPDVHIYTRSRGAGARVGDGKPEFEGYYPGREALMGEAGLQRLAVVAPLIQEWRAELGAARAAAVEGV